MTPVLRTLWSRLSLYLPVLLMGLFALGTWWLVRSVPGMIEAGGPAVLRHEPDYYLKSFSFKTFDPTGRLQREVVGTEAHHYPDTATLDIAQARIRAYDDKGQLTVASARRAVAKDDGSSVELMGLAHVVREAVKGPTGEVSPKLEFRGEYLHVERDTERLNSHLPVELIRGTDSFTADSMAYDHHSGVLDLRGRVHGVLVPRR